MKKLFKITSILLIQAMVMQSIAWAGGAVTAYGQNSYLSPFLQVDTVEFKNIFNQGVASNEQRITHGMSKVILALSGYLASRIFYAPDSAEAFIYYKKGVGEIPAQQFKFNAFNAKLLAEDEKFQRLLDALNWLILSYNKIITFTSGGSILLSDRKAYEELKKKFIKKIEGIGAEELKLLVASKPSEDFEIRWNQLIFQALPGYFAERGVLFWTNINPESKTKKLVECFELYKVKKVIPRVITIWGKRNHIDELIIEEPIMFNGKPALTQKIKRLGTTVYGNFAIFENFIDEFVNKDLNHIKRMTQFPNFENLKYLEWERVVERGLPVDPLEFTVMKLFYKISKQKPTKEKMRSLRINAIEHHEALHIMDFKQGNYPKGPPPNPEDNLAAWNEYTLHWITTLEKRAYITGIRHLDAFGRMIELTNIIESARSKKTDKLITLYSLRIVDDMISYIEKHAAEYQNIRLQPKLDLSIRAQIAGQLYRLDDKQWEHLLDVLYAEYKKPYPTTEIIKKVKELYHDRVKSKSSWFTYLGSGIAVTFTTGLLLWHWRRKQKIQNLKFMSLKKVLSQKLAPNNYAKFTDNDFREILQLLSGNEKKAVKKFEKLFKNKKVPLPPKKIKKLIKDAAHEVGHSKQVEFSEKDIQKRTPKVALNTLLIQRAI